MNDIIVGLLFLVNSQGQPVDTPHVVPFENILACESAIAQSAEQLKEYAEANPTYSGYKVIGICIDGKDIN